MPAHGWRLPVQLRTRKGCLYSCSAWLPLLLCTSSCCSAKLKEGDLAARVAAKGCETMPHCAVQAGTATFGIARRLLSAESISGCHNNDCIKCVLLPCWLACMCWSTDAAARVHQWWPSTSVRLETR